MCVYGSQSKQMSCLKLLRIVSVRCGRTEMFAHDQSTIKCVCNETCNKLILTTTMSANDGPSSLSSSRLSYTIAGCSEHSNRYVAENIMDDSPKDPNSRWSGQHESPSIKQWILLQLDELCVIGRILIRSVLELSGY